MTAMEDVLAAHRPMHAIDGWNPRAAVGCSCDMAYRSQTKHAAHVAQALTAAGFGSLHDAWEEGFSAGQHIARYTHPTAEQWEDLTHNPYPAPKVSES